MAYKFLQSMVEDGGFGFHCEHPMDGVCSIDWKPEMAETAITFAITDEYGHLLYAGMMTAEQVNNGNYGEPVQYIENGAGIEFLIDGKWQIMDKEFAAYLKTVDAIYGE